MRFVPLLMLLAFLGVSEASAGQNTPEAQIEALIKSLQTGKFQNILHNFFAGSLAAQQKPTELKAMEGQVKAAFEFYGPPMSYEIVDTKKMGRDLVNIKFISKQKDDVPLFWNALFYRRHDQWEPLAVFFFDDPRKAGFL